MIRSDDVICFWISLLALMMSSLDEIDDLVPYGVREAGKKFFLRFESSINCRFRIDDWDFSFSFVTDVAATWLSICDLALFLRYSK
ncbi:hypothetical protein TRFO_16480 [Tritrichomonas foetus]|uniref:Uncharacterized protein n=1 Tax=Tritrichomonas foetus TaxID=1144522 RepID=A0A1J4KQ01_9EUKA|nr:hypothetical protein TRFO_16480 [Tritrichomonas foetus]|eukprot:OHT13385.1 hypothetical protein TRFO_16480 [Tritrichomonas foetus]